MALMFPRLARNFVKYGYYPTDSATLKAIMAHLDCYASDVRLFDPCCGEGAALREVSEHLASFGADCTTVGIELDEERARHAKTVLDLCLQCNMEDALLSHKGVGLLFLNPPYGMMAREDLGSDRTRRFEEVFYDKTLHVLQDDGVMVLIVPEAALSDVFSARIASTLTDVQVWLAPERQFKQVVIMGRRCRNRMPAERLKTQTAMIRQFSTAPVMSDQAKTVYTVPQQTDKPFKPVCQRLNAQILSEELDQVARNELAWGHFDTIFASHRLDSARQPLCPLGKWHTALALAAGQVTGLVENEAGTQRLLIKGNTYKKKQTTVDDSAEEATVTTSIDVFVPVIKAIDVTPGSPGYGNVLVVQ